MRPSVRIVTGYIPLANHPRPMATYLTLGRRLLALPVPKVVWTTPEVRAALGPQAEATDVNVFPPSPGAPWILDLLGQRPCTVASQDPRKDTLAYHAVQHQKTQWLAWTSQQHPDDLLVWLDFGVFHLPSLHAPDVAERVVLEFLERVRDDWIALPGCRPRSPHVSLDHPTWRFCGAVVVCPGPLAGWLHRVCADTFRETVERHGKVTWEVNTWALAEASGRLPIRQYHATTHDERMFTAYDGPPS